MTARIDARVAFFIEPKTMQLAIERATLASPRGTGDDVIWLKHIWIRVAGNQIEVIGHNHQVGVRAKYTAEVIKVGDFLLPPPAFQVFRALDSRMLVQVVNEAGADSVLIQAGKFSCKLPTQDANGYLDHLPTVAYPTVLELREAMVIGMIDRTLFSVATDDSRYGLNGLYLEVTDQDDAGQDRGELYLRMVSTDGHRLSRVEAKLDRQPTGPFNALIDRSLVTIWKKLWDGTNVEASPIVKLELGENFARLSDGDLQVWGRLLEGDFPDYRQVVPRAYLNVVEVPHEPIMEMCHRSTILTSSVKQPTVRLKLFMDRGKSSLEVSSSNPDMGEYREDLEDIPTSQSAEPGTTFQIGLNPSYFTDALKALTSPQVRLCFTNAIGACVVDDKDDPTIQYVLMPVRLE